MPYYINSFNRSNLLGGGHIKRQEKSTLAVTNDKVEAQHMLRVYMFEEANPDVVYYITSKPCKAWRVGQPAH